jgi:hypothetical protein
MVAMQFTVADGATVQCKSYVPNFEWAVQVYTFHHTMNVLELGCYDTILGKDRLDLYSPMWVHWKRYILRFTHKGHHITLHGAPSAKPTCSSVSSRKQRGMIKRGVLSHVMQITGQHCDAIMSLEESSVQVSEETLPPLVVELLEEFQHLLSEPKNFTTSTTTRSVDSLIP